MLRDLAALEAINDDENVVIDSWIEKTTSARFGVFVEEGGVTSQNHGIDFALTLMSSASI